MGLKATFSILATFLCGVGSAWAGEVKSLYDPSTVSLTTFCDCVNAATSKRKSIPVKDSTFGGMARKEAEILRQKALAFSAEERRWMQLIQMNENSVFLKFRF